jgi:photosystem II stability/assembly factor-like uncharacterized protein
MPKMLLRLCGGALLAPALFASTLRAQDPTQSPSPTPEPTPAQQARTKSQEEQLFERLDWRNIGPANMGGRTADVEGVAGNPGLVYVATASGGLWKTTNGGTTWRPVFERQGTLSIGDIALEPGNPDVVWVGTGEANPRNSVSFGDGVYKSTDGGKTWQHMGLRDTRHISRILINPRNPDNVFVGALGHVFGPNPERGVFVTHDGGRTWAKTLYVDAAHGIADMDIDPQNPNVLFAAVWKFERKPWTHTSGSEQGGVFRSIDGGRTWTKLTNGLPKLVGRIGVKVAPSNPNVVYAITEAKDGILYRSDDKGETWRRVSAQQSLVSRGFYYTDLRVDPTNENRVFAIATNLFVSIDGGRTFRSITGRTHIDYHSLWIDPANPKRMWQGQDGGVAVTWDGGETWEYVNNFALGQFYQVHLDDRQPFYSVMGGLQDNGSWTGPSRTREPAGILNDDWRMVSFGDGFHMLNHPDDPDLYLSESQGGNVVRTDMRNREQQLVIPSYPTGGGPASESRHRFNWNAPLVPSPHDKETVYLGGNVLFRSTDFGKSWTAISPDLTTNDAAKQKDAGGPIAFENTTAEYHTTIISVAESPARAGVIWVGTDDGNLQVTTDGGRNWRNVIRNVPNVPANSEVSHVEPSRTSADTVYVSFDRHKMDDLRPYVFKTTDGGQTFRDVTGNLPPNAYVWVVREDPRNPNLIYAGTELGLFASYSGGTNWIPLHLRNLPAVAVHDIKIHPRWNDIVLATHGRSVYIFDDATPIQQMTPDLMRADAHLFDIRPALRFTTRFTRYGIGDRVFTGQNPPYGALVTYYLKEKPDDKVAVKGQILDSRGRVVFENARMPREKGLNRIAWDLRIGGPQVRRPPTDEETQFFGGPRGPQVVPGTYTVRLLVGDKTYDKKVEVRLDPTVQTSAADLQQVYDLAVRLRDMQSATNNSLRALDSLKAQSEFVERTVRDRAGEVPKELSDALAGFKKRLDEQTGKLARPEGGLGFSGRAQLIEKLGNMFFAVEGVNAAPTPQQRAYIEELQKEFNEKLAETNRFVAQEVPRMNETLRKHNAPQLIPGKPVEATPADGNRQ